MFLDLFRVLIEIAAALLGVALLLRLFINWVGLPGRNPIAQFVFALTDWLVRPLRRVMPAAGRLDVASLLAAYLVAVLSIVLLQLLLAPAVAWDRAALGGLRLLVQWTLNGLFWLTVLYALLSWINPHAPIAPAIGMMMRPFLAPFRRLIPLIGGVDLSPMALIVTIVILRELVDRLTL